MVEVKQSVFGKNLKAYRTTKGLTQPQIADIADVSTTTVNKWERQGVQPRRRVINTLLEYFGLSEDDLLSETRGFYAKLHGLTDAPAGAIHVTPAKGVLVPIRTLGAVHAGEPDEPWQDEGEAMLYEELAKRHPSCFALEVNGGCMDLDFTDQDFVFVDPDLEPHDGCIAVVSIDGECIVRRLKRGNDSITLVAESTDPGAYPDIIIQGEAHDVRAVGTVFWWQAREGL